METTAIRSPGDLNGPTRSARLPALSIREPGIAKTHRKVGMAESRYDDIVVGAGIIGLAHAYELARRGRRVAVLERSPAAAGASVRNFGMLWPIGQPFGEPRTLANRSLDTWRTVLAAADLPLRELRLAPPRLPGGRGRRSCTNIKNCRSKPASRSSSFAPHRSWSGAVRSVRKGCMRRSGARPRPASTRVPSSRDCPRGSGASSR